MLNKLRQDSSRRPIAVGFATACLILLAGCDSSTAPPPSRAPNVSKSPSTEKAPRHAIVVIGTRNPSVDVAAVQAAVNEGGDVVLKGHFSFDATPTQPLAPPLRSAGSALPGAAEVLVAKAVNLSGETDEEEGMTTIDAGTIPFYVDAPGQRVTIRGLRFVRPISGAILVHAVTGLEIVANKIAGVVPFAHQTNGISLTTTGILPNPTSPGSPELITGLLRIERNEIDMVGGTSGVDNTLGLTVFSVGVEGAEVDAYISGNRMRNMTEPAINFRHIIGHAAIKNNDIRTGPSIGTAARNSVIRIANTGSYLVAHNSITCEWATGDAEAIGAFSQFATWPIEHAVIADNVIRMNAPAGTAFTAFSAGIALYGFADSNVVRHNTIHGAALAALSIPSVFPLPPQPPATQQDNAFIRNRLIGFVPLDADVFVGTHAMGTRVVGSGTIDDQGTGTIESRAN